MAYISISNQMFSTASELKSQAGTDGVTVQLNGISSTNDGYGGNFLWDAASVVADDNKDTFQVTGVTTGRWIRLKNQNTVKSSSTFSGLSLTTSYTVTHGLGFTPIMIILTPTSAPAAALSYISAKTSTTFTVTFLTVPIIGTNNISFDWIAIKQ